MAVRAESTQVPVDKGAIEQGRVWCRFSPHTCAVEEPWRKVRDLQHFLPAIELLRDDIAARFIAFERRGLNKKITTCPTRTISSEFSHHLAPREENTSPVIKLITSWTHERATNLILSLLVMSLVRAHKTRQLTFGWHSWSRLIRYHLMTSRYT